jgi:hypothetical protein
VFIDLEESNAWLIFSVGRAPGLDENDVSDSQAGLRPIIIAV